MLQPASPAQLDALSAKLGDGLLLEPQALAAYSGDESHAEPVLPAAVVRVKSVEEVQLTLRWAKQHGVAVTCRGAGSGKAGGCVPQAGGIVLALEGMNSRLDIDPQNLLARVDAGVITGQLHSAAEEAGLFYGPDPASLDQCTLGGNIATNAGGPRAFRYGVTRESVLGLDVVLATGELLHLGRNTVKGVAGLDLTALVVGSEGTLGVVVGATLRLLGKARSTATLLAFFPSDQAALLAIAGVLRSAWRPSVCEFLDGATLELAAGALPFTLPAGAGSMALWEVDGEVADVQTRAEGLGQELLDAGAVDVQLAQDGAGRRRLWDMRRKVSYTVKEGSGRFLSEDVAVPLGAIYPLIKGVGAIAASSGIRAACYGHAGDGNVHVNLLCDGDQWEQALQASEQVFRLTLSLGGTITGEHGVGRLKRPYLAWEQSSPLLQAQQALKQAWDPKGILNPGVLLPGI